MSHRLALGTAQMGMHYGIANTLGKVADNDLSKMLSMAVAAKIDTLDTAFAYGDSESRLGQAGVEHFKLVTKIGEVPAEADVHHWILDQVHTSLERLQINSAYAVLLHRPKQLSSPRARLILSALEQLKENGLTQKIGASIYDPNELDGVDCKHLDLVQAPYNLIDQRLFASGLAERLTDIGIEIHARSVFLQGLLLLPAEKIPSKFSRWSRLWELRDAWLHHHNISALQACLNFSLANREISKVIVGAESLEQLSQLIHAAKNRTNDWPSMQCNDGTLIDPFNWNSI